LDGREAKRKRERERVEENRIRMGILNQQHKKRATGRKR
jgi:hypothetical protein